MGPSPPAPVCRWTWRHSLTISVDHPAARDGPPVTVRSVAELCSAPRKRCVVLSLKTTRRGLYRSNGSFIGYSRAYVSGVILFSVWRHLNAIIKIIKQKFHEIKPAVLYRVTFFVGTEPYDVIIIIIIVIRERFTGSNPYSF